MSADIPIASVRCDAKTGQEGTAAAADTANVTSVGWIHVNARWLLQMRDRLGEAEN